MCAPAARHTASTARLCKWLKFERGALSRAVQCMAMGCADESRQERGCGKGKRLRLGHRQSRRQRPAPEIGEGKRMGCIDSIASVRIVYVVP